MEQARDQIRQQLHNVNPHFFPIEGRDGTDLYELCRVMLGRSDGHVTKTLMCAHCGAVNHAMSDDIVLWDCSASVWKESPLRLGSYNNRTMSEWLHPLLFRKSRDRCEQCDKRLSWHFTFNHHPMFMVFAVYGMDIQIEHTLVLPNDTSYRLCGIIYFGAFHFTCRVFTTEGEQWFNDGITTGKSSAKEQPAKLGSIAELNHAHGRKASAVLYVKA